MSSFRKVHIVPEDKLKSLQECAAIRRESLERILRISLFLAKINGYNSDLQIRAKSGQFLTDSNILELIEKLETEEKELYGEEDFIYLLREANVPLSLIKNENIRSKLASLYNEGLQHSSSLSNQPSTVSVTEKPSIDQYSWLPTPIVKRTEDLEETVPDPHWRYHNYFNPNPPKRNISREAFQWRQM